MDCFLPTMGSNSPIQNIIIFAMGYLVGLTRVGSIHPIFLLTLTSIILF